MDKEVRDSKFERSFLEYEAEIEWKESLDEKEDGSFKEPGISWGKATASKAEEIKVNRGISALAYLPSHQECSFMSEKFDTGDKVEVLISYGFTARWESDFTFVRHDICRGEETVLVKHTKGLYKDCEVRFAKTHVRSLVPSSSGF